MIAVTPAEYERVLQEFHAYDTAHPELMVSFSNGGIKSGTEYHKVFWIVIGLNPYPFEILVTRAETQSCTPREALEKAMALAEFRHSYG